MHDRLLHLCILNSYRNVYLTHSSKPNWWQRSLEVSRFRSRLWRLCPLFSSKAPPGRQRGDLEAHPLSSSLQRNARWTSRQLCPTHFLKGSSWLLYWPSHRANSKATCHSDQTCWPLIALIFTAPLVPSQAQPVRPGPYLCTLAHSSKVWPTSPSLRRPIAPCRYRPRLPIKTRTRC